MDEYAEILTSAEAALAVLLAIDAAVAPYSDWTPDQRRERRELAQSLAAKLSKLLFWSELPEQGPVSLEITICRQPSKSSEKGGAGDK